jgi:NADH-quinone oxidoreductase subunit N
MYFDEPADQPAVDTHGGVGVLLALNGAAALVLGLVPQGLMAVCRDVIVAALQG